MEKYKDSSQHEDLIAFSICGEYLSYSPDAYEEEENDFDKLIVIVVKDWLFNLIKRTENFRTDDEVKRFLNEEYTSDDSIVWYEEAILANKIVMTVFN